MGMVEGSQLGAFCPWIGHNVLLPWIQICYLKNLKLFSIRMKEYLSLGPIGLQKSADGFLSFKSIFLRNTALWVTLGDFTLKRAKLGDRYLTENRFGRNEIWCAKRFLDSNFNFAVINKISIFQEIAPNFEYSWKLQCFKYNWNFLDQLLLRYKSYGREMYGIYFFHYCQLWADKASDKKKSTLTSHQL